MHYEVVDWGAQVLTSTTITVPSDSSEHFYGFGEKFDTLDQAGNRVHMLTMDTAGTKGDNSYKVASWFMSTKGYVFIWTRRTKSYFDMRNSAPDRYVINNLVGNSNFGGYVTNAVKFNVVYGPSLPDVLTRYTVTRAGLRCRRSGHLRHGCRATSGIRVAKCVTRSASTALSGFQVRSLSSIHHGRSATTI